MRLQADLGDGPVQPGGGDRDHLRLARVEERAFDLAVGIDLLQGEAAGSELSNATARANDGTVQLQFNTPLQSASAGDTDRYEVRVNGQAAEVEAVSYRTTGNTITLSLRLEALHPGDRVAVNWSDLLDAQGRSLSGSIAEITAR